MTYNTFSPDLKRKISEAILFSDIGSGDLPPNVTTDKQEFLANNACTSEFHVEEPNTLSWETGDAQLGVSISNNKNHHHVLDPVMSNQVKSFNASGY